MNTSMSWIKMYVPDLDVTAQEYTDAMTLSGTKVEGFEKLDADLDKIVIGQIEKIEKHPDADKRKIRIHSCLFCLRTQCSQMFRLQFIYIHKRNQRNHSQEEQRQYKCCFYCQTSLLNLSPKRGAERYFYRRNFSNMFFCICPKIFPTLLGE